MPEAQYYSSKHLLVTSATVTYKGQVIPVSGITSIDVRKPKPDAGVGTSVAGFGILLCGVGGAVLILRIAIGSGVAAVFLGITLGAAGVWCFKRGMGLYRAEQNFRLVHIRLGSGDSVLVEAVNESSAGKIHEAIQQAIKAHGGRSGTESSVADELEKLSTLRGAGVLTEDDWERAKDLYLGKRPDERAAAVSQLRKLYDLHKEGVLSESEFNSKKWDVLIATT